MTMIDIYTHMFTAIQLKSRDANLFTSVQHQKRELLKSANCKFQRGEPQSTIRVVALVNSRKGRQQHKWQKASNSKGTIGRGYWSKHDITRGQIWTVFLHICMIIDHLFLGGAAGSPYSFHFDILFYGFVLRFCSIYACICMCVCMFIWYVRCGSITVLAYIW